MDVNCQSCGLPMMIDADHGGNNTQNPYCKYCTDSAGNLKTRVEIREGMITLYMQSFGKPREEAEKEVDDRMSKMPAWKDAYQQGGVSVAAPVQLVQPPVMPTVPSAPVVPPVETQPQPVPPVQTMPEVPTVEAVTVPPTVMQNQPVQPVISQPIPTVPVATEPVQPVEPTYISQMPAAQSPSDLPVVEPPSIPTGQIVSEATPSPFPVQEANGQPAAPSQGDDSDDGVGSDSE